MAINSREQEAYIDQDMPWRQTTGFSPLSHEQAVSVSVRRKLDRVEAAQKRIVSHLVWIQVNTAVSTVFLFGIFCLLVQR